MEKLFEGAKTTSLRYAYVIPGDLYYVPFGHLFVEKAIRETNTSIRANSMLICKDDYEAATVFAKAYVKYLRFYGCFFCADGGSSNITTYCSYQQVPCIYNAESKGVFLEAMNWIWYFQENEQGTNHENKIKF